MTPYVTPETVSFKVENEPVMKTFCHVTEFKLYALLVVSGVGCGNKHHQL